MTFACTTLDDITAARVFLLEPLITESPPSHSSSSLPYDQVASQRLQRPHHSLHLLLLREIRRCIRSLLLVGIHADSHRVPLPRFCVTSGKESRRVAFSLYLLQQLTGLSLIEKHADLDRNVF